jgi:hypothetical protein
MTGFCQVIFSQMVASSQLLRWLYSGQCSCNKIFEDLPRENGLLSMVNFNADSCNPDTSGLLQQCI